MLLVLVLGVVIGIALTLAAFAVSGNPGVVSHPAQSGSVEDLVRAGRKLEAIRRYRAQHGVGLAAAKEAVEAIARGEAPAPPPAVEAQPDVEALVRAGQVLEAIRLYRARHGVGLAEAKAAVDALRAGEPRG